MIAERAADLIRFGSELDLIQQQKIYYHTNIGSNTNDHHFYYFAGHNQPHYYPTRSLVLTNRSELHPF